MAHDPHLAELLRQALEGRAGISEKKMFGGVCFLLNGNMFAGVANHDSFMFRVGKDLEAEALTRPGARPMDFTGRKMGGLIWVEADAAIEAGLKQWLDFTARFVGALPPK
ncbi:TfoX/Sxy family protein [Hoeflea prorocentri]|uniref:TfoX/Sxy family protein n=1 Tax=Hoeflea prorocentri TaxID=1922333 RepID=A0A9X3ZG13_9HYPH|nr:TfoX/Sxy family protein [Hoeflea prorocentri]MCY6380262.1 TfoX/Sxy family protein [Hoeflea prorocentri]MDA5398062.1 TfoX/Sxy family protein [Hoeflea prorocentri]